MEPKSHTTAARIRYGFATSEVADELDYYLEHDCYGSPQFGWG